MGYDSAAGRATAPLDLRSLPAPEPMERALEAAETLPDGARLSVLTPRMPYPLIQLLGERGFAVAAEPRPDGSALLSIQRPATGSR